jgi:hypothetical protein
VHVNFSADVTSISDKKDLASDATLFEIDDANSEEFKNDDLEIITAGVAISSKKIMLNEISVIDMMNGDDNTPAHEAGHTAGLRHPTRDFQWGFLKLFKIQGYTYNSPSTNFMQSNSSENSTGATRQQLYRMFMLYSQGKLNQNTSAIDEEFEKPLPAK